MDPEDRPSNIGLGVTIPSPVALPSISPLVNSAILSPHALSSAPSTIALPSMNTPALTPSTAIPSSAGGYHKPEDPTRAALHLLNVTPSSFNISPSITSANAASFDASRGSVPTPDYTPNQLLDRAQALAVPLQTYKVKTSSEIEKLTDEELRTALINAQNHIGSLEQDLMKTRTASSHSALQHAMLAVGFENERDRFEVERTMAKREVEVLKRHQESGGGAFQQARLNELRSDIDVLRNRLKRAKAVILTEREKVHTLTKDNERLKKRIKENRQHNNMAERAMITAEAEAGRRRQLGQSAHRSTRSNVEDGLAALGQVASQALAEQRDEEARVTAANSPMHTPARHTPALERFGSSSMHTPPSQPQQQQHSQQSQHPHLMSPVALSPARYTTGWTNTTLTPGKKHQRARDDTISASEGENSGTKTTTSRSKGRPSQSGGAAPPAKRQRTSNTPKTPKPRAKPAKQPASASGPKTGVIDLSAKKRKGASTAPSTPAPEPRAALQYSPRPDLADRSRLDETHRRVGFQ